MSAVFDKNSRICAVCEFWKGYRELRPSRDGVNVETGTRGGCIISSVSITGPSQNCQNFKKWAILK